MPLQAARRHAPTRVPPMQAALEAERSWAKEMEQQLEGEKTAKLALVAKSGAMVKALRQQLEEAKARLILFLPPGGTAAPPSGAPARLFPLLPTMWGRTDCARRTGRPGCREQVAHAKSNTSIVNSGHTSDEHASAAEADAKQAGPAVTAPRGAAAQRRGVVDLWLPICLLYAFIFFWCL